MIKIQNKSFSVAGVKKDIFILVFFKSTIKVDTVKFFSISMRTLTLNDIKRLKNNV